MSMCICIQNEDELIIAADTAVTKKVGQEIFRLRQPYQKLRHIGHFLVFGAGSADVMEDVFTRFSNETTKTADTLRSIVVDCCERFKRQHRETYDSLPEDGRDVAVLAAEMVQGKSVVYVIDPRNGFKVNTTRVGPASSTPHTGGYFASEAATYFGPLLHARMPADEIIVKTFDHFSGAEVGGNITMALMNSQGIHFGQPIPIKESVRLRYYSDFVGGQLIGAQIMTNPEGVFPRAGMSNTERMFRVESSDDSMIEMRSVGSVGGRPSLEFKSGEVVTSFRQTPDINTGLYVSGNALHAELGRITLRGYDGVHFLGWSNIKSEGLAPGSIAQTLQQALDAKADNSRVASLEARVAALEAR